MALSPPPPLTSLYTLSFLLALLTTTIVAASLRLLAILPRTRTIPPKKRPRSSTARIVVVLGSGGHTHEMFALLRDLDTRRYAHRTYVVSSGDAFSGERAREFEEGLEAQARTKDVDARGAVVRSTEGDKGKHTQGGEKGAKQHLAKNAEDAQIPPNTGPAHYTILTLPRARKVHQPLLTTPLSALRTLFATFPILLSSPDTSSSSSSSSDLPDLLLTNGPGTAIILIYAALLLRFFNVRGAESRAKLRSIYVESFARVSSLSLSAKLVGWCVDRFVVQWEGLKGAGGGRGEYHGVLV